MEENKLTTNKLAFIIIRTIIIYDIFAIIFAFLRGIPQYNELSHYKELFSFHGNILILIIPIFLLIFIGFILWIKTQSIANWISPESQNSIIDLKETTPFLDIVIIIIGIIFFIQSIPSLFSNMFTLSLYKHLSMKYAGNIVQYKSNVFYSIIKMLVSLFLIFKSKGIISIINKYRT